MKLDYSELDKGLIGWTYNGVNWYFVDIAEMIQVFEEYAEKHTENWVTSPKTADLTQETDVLDIVIKRYGTRMQTVVAIEEMAELQKELCKALRGEDRKKEITEEIADVDIMIEQLQRMYGITPREVDDVVTQKMLRLEKRLDELSD